MPVFEAAIDVDPHVLQPLDGPTLDGLGIPVPDPSHLFPKTIARLVVVQGLLEFLDDFLLADRHEALVHEDLRRDAGLIELTRRDQNRDLAREEPRFERNCIGQLQKEPCLGVLLAELEELPAQPVLPDPLDRSHEELGPADVLEFARVDEDLFELLQVRLELLEKLATLDREHVLAALTLEERETDVLLEVIDLKRNRRLRQPQSRGGFGDRAHGGDVDENAEALETVLRELT